MNDRPAIEDAEADAREEAIACVIYGTHRRLLREDVLFWEELPDSAKRHWRYIAGEALRYMDVLMMEIEPPVATTNPTGCREASRGYGPSVGDGGGS